MITLDDCVEFCGVDSDTVRALAREEHLPVIVASALCSTLARSPEGRAQIAYMLRHCGNCSTPCDNLEEAGQCYRAFRDYRAQVIRYS